MNTLSKALLTFLVFSVSLIVSAEEEEEVRYYDVEVILFENLDNVARQSENWPSSVELELPETLIEIGQPYPGPIPKEYQPRLTFKPLAKKELQLQEQATTIDESESRRLLLHTGWRQPGMPREKALSVHLKRSVPGVSAGGVDTEVAGDPMAMSRLAQPQAGELEGTIKVILSRYLHVETDIVFRPQREELQDDIYSLELLDKVDQPVVYRINQIRRRMRSREIHYLDNPVIGMLVLITPYEIEQSGTPQ
ncbi:MAG: peptidoglycan binding protein CsiV [Gammaproteobacteria bacterium]|nr:peptidoglycan binding protein CsiV [Gammaproteobacteria bacterium]